MMGHNGMPMMSGARGGMMAGPADTAAAPLAVAHAATAPECPSVSQALVDAGRQVFTRKGNCYACHGSDARGSPVAPDLRDTTWLDVDGSYAAISDVVRAGVQRPKQYPARMPAMGGAQLDHTQICAVAAYVYSLSR